MFFMVKVQNPNLLCKLGLHKWRNYGESVVVTWKEPIYGAGRVPLRIRRRLPLHTRGKKVLSKRKCLRCRINMKRILVKNPDGTLSSVGWEPISECEKDEHKEPQYEMRRRKMVR